MKTCRKCGELFVGERCIPCRKAFDAMRAVRDKEKIAERKARWYQENKANIQQARREHYRENREQVYARNRAWALANPEKMRAYAQKHYQLHTDRVQARHKLWAQEHPWVRRSIKQNRRARILVTEGRLSSNLASTLYVAQKGLCALCGLDMQGKYHLDHIVPLALGGENVDSNIQLLHPRCNQRKSARSLEAVARLKEQLHGTIC